MTRRWSSVVSVASLAVAGLAFYVAARRAPAPGEGVPATADEGRARSAHGGVRTRLAELERRLARLEERARDALEQPSTAASSADANEDNAATIEELRERVRDLESRALENEGDPIARGYAYLESNDANVRREGVRLLRRFGRRDTEILSTLRALLDDEDPGVRVETLEGLKDAEDHESVPTITERLVDDDARVREKATEVLAELLGERDVRERSPGVPGAVSHLLDDESAAVREAAADALGGLAATEAVPRLIEALDDPVSDVRDKVVESLVELGARAATLAIRAQYEKVIGEENPSSDERLRLAAALKELGQRDAFDAEVERLAARLSSEPDPQIRRDVLRTLAWLGSERNTEIFEPALNDPDAGVRETARAALTGSVGD